jgi:predicted acyl esterase
MKIDWDVPIEMDDGLVLRADVFRPIDDDPHPVILSYGPYAKGLAFQDGYPDQWNRMVTAFPEVAEGSTNAYQSWEVVDPEKWVPRGYAVVRVDSRGTGTSPGFIDHFSPRETKDFHDCIEWAGVQSWSNGKVGLNGISYYGINQWHVASLQPPHLAAMCIWEGAGDHFRDMTRHGGILSTFWANWYDMQVKTVQYGLGDRGPKSNLTGRNACGDVTLSDEELAANRADLGGAIVAHPTDDDYHRARSPRYDRIITPLLSAGNWGGAGLHLRGNTEGFVRAASKHKWLEVHGIEHWTHFYTDYGRELQLQFFDHFLKGEDNGWNRRPPVLLQVRHVDGFEQRTEAEWPIPGTRWTDLHLTPNLTLSDEPASATNELSFDAMSDGLTFRSTPFPEQTEVTGPLALSLWVSSTTTDADIFAVVRVFDPDGREVTFQGALDPRAPVAQGWLRASHRALDAELSLPYRPYHTHADPVPLEPGAVYRLDVEIWPTSIVIPAGYTLAVSVRGRDYENDESGDGSGAEISTFKNRFSGCGPFLHNDPTDRPADVFGGTTTLHFGPEHPTRLLAPIIPARD